MCLKYSKVVGYAASQPIAFQLIIILKLTTNLALLYVWEIELMFQLIASVQEERNINYIVNGDQLGILEILQVEVGVYTNMANRFCQTLHKMLNIITSQATKEIDPHCNI